uniref:Kringle domain-containing protein n=1 Tax=Branchiostoma floridae TaxID=7739 RepID=C3YGA1_BRAFL|eukprot:XP_002604611.1 hypothetical protein BRAFLDRAFT_92845 [Branchiostoma floridae]
MAENDQEVRPANDQICIQGTVDNSALDELETHPYQQPEPVRFGKLQSNIESTGIQEQIAAPCSSETDDAYDDPQPVILQSSDGQSDDQMTGVAQNAPGGTETTVENQLRLRQMYGDHQTKDGTFCSRVRQSMSRRPWLLCGAVTTAAVIALVAFGIYLGMVVKANAVPQKKVDDDRHPNSVQTLPSDRCYGDGSDYRGRANVTISGKVCQRWDSQTPHRHSFSPNKHPAAGLEQNYCRNPDHDDCPWCFTLDPYIRYDCCDICELE